MSRARSTRTNIIVLGLVLALAGPAVGAPPQDPQLAVLGPGAVRLENGHYRITLADGTTLQTHGADPKPSHGGGMGPGDPERAPACASDYFQHVLYGRRSNAPDRYAEVKASLQAAVRRMNAVLNEESLLSGGPTADYKVKCDANGEIEVGSFVASGQDFTQIVDGARAAGFDDGKADYTIFFDDQQSGVCGIGSYRRDDRLVEGNLSNSGGDYAVTYSACWNNETPMHENGHNQGAVQRSAPYSTGSGGHCYDENDVMCYSPDGGDANQGGTISRCTDRIHFDCGHDTYFDSSPEAGEWLETHWNIGSPLNRFILFGRPETGPPIAAFTISCTDLTCDFADASMDDTQVVSWAWSFGDGNGSTDQQPSHSYVSPGTRLVKLTVTDDTGTSSSTAQTLTVPNDGDPDPATPNLTNGRSTADRNGPDGTWRYYKIEVPAGRHNVTVSLDGPSCVLLVCNPDLDLYLRRGQRPTTTAYECEANALSNDETCTVTSPGGGYWYVGVYTFFAVPTPVVNVSTASFTVTARY